MSVSEICSEDMSSVDSPADVAEVLGCLVLNRPRECGPAYVSLDRGGKLRMHHSNHLPIFFQFFTEISATTDSSINSSIVSGDVAHRLQVLHIRGATT